MSTRARVIGGGALALVLAGGGTAAGLVASGASAAAAARPSSAAMATSAATLSTQAPARAIRQDVRRHLRFLLRHTIHADLIVRTKSGFETIVIDRGHLTSVSSGEISITRPDHVAISAVITSATRFVGLEKSQLAKGDRVIVVQSGGDALDIGALPPRSPSATAAAAA